MVNRERMKGLQSSVPLPRSRVSKMNPKNRPAVYGTTVCNCFRHSSSSDRSLLSQGGFQHNGNITGTFWSHSHLSVYALLID